MAAGLTSIYAIFVFSIFAGSRKITKLVSANPQYEKPQRQLLRWSRARDRQMAPPIYEEKFLQIVEEFRKTV